MGKTFISADQALGSVVFVISPPDGPCKMATVAPSSFTVAPSASSTVM
jgi:hypothetical protein